MTSRRPSKPADTRAIWTKQKEALLKKHFPTASWPELLKMFPGHTRAALNSKARLLGLSRPNLFHQAKADEKKEAADDLRSSLATFLSRARTEKEVEAKFGKDGLAELARIIADPPKGCRLKEGRNAYQEKTRFLERVLFDRASKIQPRIFEVRHAENDPDYLAITFPQSLDFTKDPEMNALRIFPIDSVYFGDHLCDEEAFAKYLSYLEKKPYAFAFLNGSIIGGSNYNAETALEIREDFKRRLAPVAHKILFAQSGMLEAKMTRVDGIDPLSSVCQDLGIHHTDRPVSMDVYWKEPTKPIEFYCIHGRSNARKDGAKINSVLEIMVTNNFPHFTVLGNLKEGNVNTMTVRRLDPIDFTVKEHSAITIICPGFLKYQGSLAEKKGYPPPATGTVVCIIGADNSHKASS